MKGFTEEAYEMAGFTSHNPQPTAVCKQTPEGIVGRERPPEAHGPL